MATIDSELDQSAPRAHSGGAAGARGIWLASGAFLATAAVLAIAPRVSPEAGTWIGKLSRAGLTWPLVAGFGCVIGAIAATARRARADEAPATTEPDEKPAIAPLSDDPLARELASELARVRGSLHDLRIEFVYVKDALARMQQAATESSSDSDHDAEAAIFRLAASLDQIGGRIEQQLASQRALLTEALEQPARSETSAPLRFDDPYVQGFEGPEHEIDLPEGYVSNRDDYHVEVSLDDDPAWVQGLGVLDDIHEPRAPIGHPKTSASGRPAGRSPMLDSLDGPALERARLEAKMTHLRSLLADPAVQRALSDA